MTKKEQKHLGQRQLDGLTEFDKRQRMTGPRGCRP